MGILALQKQAAQAGRIRLGHKVSGVSKRTNKAYTRPAKLETFRFTTGSRHAAEAVAALLGGEPRPWEDAPTAGQWEVFTERSEVGVILPPGPKAIDSWYEMWQPKMCVRRCDGATEQMSQQACPCPPDLDRRAAAAARGEACRMTTRIQLMIPDLPGVGVWMLESHGYYAAVEMTGVAEMLASVGSRGMTIPAQLRIEQRERRIYRGPDSEPEQRSYPVPVLEPLVSLRDIHAAVLEGTPLRASLPPQVQPVRAITAAPSGASVPAQAPRAVEALANVQALSKRSAAEDLARRAHAAGSVDEVRGLWKEAAAEWLLNVEVDVPDSDEVSELRELLLRYTAELETSTVSTR